MRDSLAESMNSNQHSGSKEPTNAIDESTILPLESAADVGKSNYVRVQFDQHISEILEEHARGRAPAETNFPDKSYRNHLLGVASEVAVATWRGGQIDRRILPDFVGDGGVDVMAQSKWGEGRDSFQVKATRNISNPEHVVSRAELKMADYFVLCCTNAPAKYIEIIGYTSQFSLETVGTAYGRDGYLLSPEILYPTKPALYTPDDVREKMYG